MAHWRRHIQFIGAIGALLTLLPVWPRYRDIELPAIRIYVASTHRPSSRHLFCLFNLFYCEDVWWVSLVVLSWWRGWKSLVVHFWMCWYYWFLCYGVDFLGGSDNPIRSGWGVDWQLSYKALLLISFYWSILNNLRVKRVILHDLVAFELL